VCIVTARGGWGVRVVSVGRWHAVQGGVFVFGPADHASRMDNHLFRIGYLYLVKVVEHRQCRRLLRPAPWLSRQGRHCDDLMTHGPRADRSIPSKKYSRRPGTRSRSPGTRDTLVKLGRAGTWDTVADPCFSRSGHPALARST